MNNINEIANIDSKYVQEISGIIPDEIFNLLWFPDGPYKNFNPDIKDLGIQIGGLNIDSSLGMGSIGSTEPSALYYRLPIAPPQNLEAIAKLPYFPSYAGLTREQRWIYLNWLKDIDSKVDTGYVFLFYYGLERHLLYGKYDKAFKIILRLRENHRNKSFINYSSDALIKAGIMYNRTDLLEEYLESEDKSEKNKISSLYLIFKYGANLNLTVEDLMVLSKDIGFSNQRYLKKEKKLFEIELKKILVKKYKMDTFQITQYPLKEAPKRKEVFFVNYSIKEEDRFKELPCLLNYKPFKNDVYNLLQVAHDNVKEHISNVRKTTKFKPTK